LDKIDGIDKKHIDANRKSKQRDLSDLNNDALDSISLKAESESSQNKTAEIVFFNKFGTSLVYDVFSEKGYKRIIDEFLKYFTPAKDLKVMDFGCGTGSFISRFLDYGMQLHGMDISQNCINYAKSRYAGILFNIGDIENTGFPDGTFDVIFLSGVLHHFYDFTKALQECHRVLKKGGVVLGYDPHKMNPFFWLYRSKNSPFNSIKGITENERILTKKEIKDAIKSSGFSEYDVYSISGVSYKYIEHKLAFLFLPIYNFLEQMMDLPILRSRFGSFLISYARK